MNCYCGATVACIISKAGTTCYTCASNRCRFYALTPVQVKDYRRFVPLSGKHNDSVLIRFEALLHPETRVTHVTAIVSTLECNAVVAVLEDAQFHPMWYTTREAYLYPMEYYAPLVSALKRLTAPKVDVEEIPFFFFRCLHAAQELLVQHERNIDGSASQDADVDDIVYSQLRPFQKRGVNFILSRSGRGMIADDMGLGKTVQALAVAHHYRDEWPVLVVCPLSLVENWAKEFTRFCSIPAGRIAILQTTKMCVADMHSVVIVPYSSLKCLDTLPLTFKVVILDESHYIKSVDSKRTMAALKICRAARRVLLLSGTPTLSRPIELYPQLQAIMDPSWAPTKTQFGARYCNGFVGRFGVDFSGHSNMSELHVLLQHFLIRRTKQELEGELPSKSRQLLYMYITPKEKKALEKGVLALRNSLKDGSALPVTGASDGLSIPAASRVPTAFDLKIATARAKIAAVQDYVRSTVEQMVESSQKVIFFAHHQCMMEAIRDAVESVQPKQPLDFIYITGETPASQREALATHFRTAPKCHAAVLSMHSCGVGHNLTCATMVVFAELDWNPSTHLQCEDRVHRIGQSSACVIKYLLAEGTSDSVIWPMLQTKLSVTHAVLEDTATASDEWSATADTRHILRSDVCLTPSSQVRKQTTLDGFISNSGSRSRQMTQNNDTTSTNSSDVAATVGNIDLTKVANECSQADATPEALGGGRVAAASDVVILDMTTLRQRREAKLIGSKLPLSSPKCSEVVSTPVTTTAVLPKPAVTGDLSSAQQGAEGLRRHVTRTTTIFRVTAATATLPKATFAASDESPCASDACRGSGELSASSSSSTAVRSPFVVRLASTTPLLASSVIDVNDAGRDDLSSVAASADVHGVNHLQLVPSPRIEEIRRYNARRTLFMVKNVGMKRSREDCDEGSPA